MEGNSTQENQREFYPGEEAYENDDRVYFVKTDDDYHLYQNENRDLLYVVQKDGFCGYYRAPAIGVKAPHGYSKDADRVDPVKDAYVMLDLVKEVWLRLNETQRAAAIMVILDEGKDYKTRKIKEPPRVNFFRNVFNLELLNNDDPKAWVYKINGLANE